MNLDRLEESINLISSGGAVCFTGAGFSQSGFDQNGDKILSTEGFQQEILDFLQIDSGESPSLSDLADFCQDSEAYKSKLTELIVNKLTYCGGEEHHKIIANLPWRAFFTTNFDDLIEQSRTANDLQLFSPMTENRNISKGRKPLYYLHGRARDIVDFGTDPSLIISERNYLDIKSRNRDLYAQLQNEIVCANLIVFIGYSLRDLEIAQIIFKSHESIKSKTVIISGPNMGVFAQKRLEKFGRVFPVGVDGFAKLAAASGSIGHTPEAYVFLEEVTLPGKVGVVDADSVDRLILTGAFDLSCFATQKLGHDKGDIYCVDRSHLATVIFDDDASRISRFVVTSDIGNGKSIFLRQVSYNAISSGYRVFWISSNLPEIHEEIERVIASSQRYMFIIDDMVRYKYTASFIGQRLNDNGVLLCSSREEFDKGTYEKLSNELSGQIKEISLNELSQSDVENWDAYLERWGLWEERIQLSHATRISFLSNQCNGENRSIVVSIFRDSYIGRKIDQIVNFFLHSNPEHKKAFIAILIASLCQGHVKWESMVLWLNINEHSLRMDIERDPIFSFLKGGIKWYSLASTQLADYIFRKEDISLENDTIVNIYTTIVRETAYSANDSRSGFEFRENLKELLKYRFLTRLFGDDSTAAKIIETVYKKLSDVPRIRKNDQFWLQYAMAKMSDNDLVVAERYIKVALGLAAQRGMEYSPHQILDQRVRLYFRKNTIEGKRFSVPEISQALDDIQELVKRKDEEIIYQFRSIPFIRDFLETHIDDLEEELRGRILITLNVIKGKIKGMSNIPRSQKGEATILKKSLEEAFLLIKFG